MASVNFLMASKNRKNPLVERKVNIITMGCSKNLVDSEQLAYQLEANDFKVYHESPTPQPITIINTCGFILDAKEESIAKILECVQLKKDKQIQVLIVYGCLAERYKNDLKKEIPEVDIFLGSNALENILQFLQATYYPERMLCRKTSTPQHYAYLKISEGCSHQCAFCAIPKIRGKQISKSIATLKQEAEILADQGVKELILVAQDLSFYGYDLHKDYQLPKLVEELAKINGFEWIRLHYLYPNSFPLQLLDIIKEHPNICRYIDMPVQHISDNVLQQMNRKITGDKIRKLLDTIKTEISDVALRTSLIVGFPTETKKDFQQLTDFVQEGYFDRLGVFTYSHEENTPAGKNLTDKISSKEKIRRQEQIMDIQHNVSFKKNQQKIGQTLKIIIDETNSNYAIGRTEFDSPEVDNTIVIHSNDNQNISVGNFYNAQIIKADAFDLEAKII
ncbi:MAG: 30S ribosomal protein S12 methylthiotransferase RimO [Bacteroidales bacterium]|nr:30S ribosomal protein S12 methylthiotransferase RimO [Bacteroidales bacterium]